MNFKVEVQKSSMETVQNQQNKDENIKPAEDNEQLQ